MPAKGFQVCVKVWERIRELEEVDQRTLEALVMEEANIILPSYIKKYIDAMLKLGLIRKTSQNSYEPLKPRRSP